MELKHGHIIGFTGDGPVSAGINLATYALPWSGFSHIGIVGMVHGDPILYESTSFERPPCVRTGKKIQGVQAHLMEDVLKWPGDHKLWHVPLRRELFLHEADRLQWWLDRWVGTPYDMFGAARSGGFIFRSLQALIRPENLSSLFCSELVAAGLIECGMFQTRSASKWSPNSLYRALRRRGVVDERRRLK